MDTSYHMENRTTREKRDPFYNLERELKIRGLSRKTIKAYLLYNRIFIEWVKKSPRDVGQEDVKRYLEHLVDHGSAASTVNVAINALKFYYAQILIYIFISIFMTAISVNIFKNAKAKLPIKADALIKNAFKNYISYIIYAIIVIFLIILLKRADTFIFTKLTQAFFKNLPNVASKFYFIGVSLSLFFANVILEVFLVLTIPAMVIQKKPLFKALWASLYLGFRNFFSIFGLIFLPFLAYLPVTLLKSMSMPLADKMFPEINLYITVMGIIIALFIDCYIILCASQFLLDRETKK